MVKIKPLEDIIRSHAFFDGLTPDISSLIAGCARNVRFKAGEMIYRLGDAADTFYVVRHGRVALEMPAAGKALCVETLDGGDILNASWLVPPYTCRFDARAVDDTRAIAFDAVCLRQKCDADSAVGYDLMKRFVPVMVERLTHARIQAMDLYAGGSTAQ
ncbi:cyclic nucleotide-binding domain-containing protein [Hyphococcus luteus]|uniref:Crp/Fnr family transcriptional regulator n=1 Tax=Hyphococcus luteus TaxID=2058213 RepID=A0A2S7K0L5_9PROT|nr:cyclic nucleotide-binding domain-containing protein [Marinicaulis flavus]PQA85968.1 Crp/Fnr family transcriptional regulator [Marinicaulis flavus]